MSSQNALKDLLRALVREWGLNQVQAVLANLSDSNDTSDESRLRNSLDGIQRTRHAPKLLAIQRVDRAHLPEAQQLVLRELARRFDGKEFLPSTADIREFLIMMGASPKAIRDRSEGFRQVLDALSDLSPERLGQLANSASHSGPAQLGPVSDAISRVAATIQRYREPSAS